MSGAAVQSALFEAPSRSTSRFVRPEKLTEICSRDNLFLPDWSLQHPRSGSLCRYGNLDGDGRRVHLGPQPPGQQLCCVSSQPNTQQM